LNSVYHWRNVTIKNERRLKLAGILYTGPAQSTAVIVCHGFTGSKEGGGRALAMAEVLGGLGYSTLLFDFSGCGESEGIFSDISLSGHINDLKCAVDFCFDSGFKSAVTVGRSFGGTAVLCHGGYDKRVAGVSSWSAPADPFRHFSGYLKEGAGAENNLIPLTGQDGTVIVKNSFFDDLSRHDVTGSARLISPRPLLVVHGEDDNVVPLLNAHNIFSAAGEPKAIKIVPGADHQYTGHYQEAWKVFFSWLAKYFPA
jgi:pimeloyl-ACP methyl ester carboxylesterase